MPCYIVRSVGQFFKRKLQKVIILAPVHIILFPIQGKGKIARESGPKKLKKVHFQAQIGLFMVLTTLTGHTKAHMGT
jgi:hypothetical protein